MAIEQRITSALTNRDIKPDALGELIVETESAIAAAEKAAEAECAKALDPLQSPDADAAHAAMRSAEFAVQRLQSVLPRLQQRYRAIEAQETYNAWATTFDPLVPKHRAAAEKLRTIYTELVPQLIEALTEDREIDAEVRRVANAKPHHLPQANGDGRSLPTVELAARGLTGVSPDFSLMTMKLPAFDAPNQLAWPPYEVPLAVQVAAAMLPVASDPRQYTGEWWKVQRERAQAAREQQQREHQERQVEIDANYHGPRWWERTAS